MEGVLAYVYWQTLSINEFDSISHFLRVLGINDPNCSPYTADARPASMGGQNPRADAARRCASYLGPYQPGVTAPDPTANGAAASAQNARPVSKLGAPRGRGQPEAPPVKGQPDYSHPNPTLPPSVQDLLNGLTGQHVPATPSLPPAPLPSNVDPSQALDYLLGP
jgi:hypothetical protein